ncbi:unnamed protein product [Closterium sp. Naga37s-1]|nr:unnamed protein product [Closterium sp. Naga37s-1]
MAVLGFWVSFWSCPKSLDLVRVLLGLWCICHLKQINVLFTKGAQGRSDVDGHCVRGGDAAAMEEQPAHEVEVLRRTMERNPDDIRFQLEVDICRARIVKLEEQVQAGTSEADKMGALERLNHALREELLEALHKIEAQKGQGEVLQREKEEFRAKSVRMEEQARVQCGVAEEQVRTLSQQVAAFQQAEFALKMQVVERDRQKADLERELNACQAEQARNAAERDQFARETAQLLRAGREVRLELVEEKERADEELAAANERNAAAREKAEVQERQLRAELEEAQKQMEVLVEEKERAEKQVDVLVGEKERAEKQVDVLVGEKERAQEHLLEAREKVRKLEDFERESGRVLAGQEEELRLERERASHVAGQLEGRKGEEDPVSTSAAGGRCSRSGR